MEIEWSLSGRAWEHDNCYDVSTTLGLWWPCTNFFFSFFFFLLLDDLVSYTLSDSLSHYQMLILTEPSMCLSLQLACHKRIDNADAQYSTPDSITIFCCCVHSICGHLSAFSLYRPQPTTTTWQSHRKISTRPRSVTSLIRLQMKTIAPRRERADADEVSVRVIQTASEELPDSDISPSNWEQNRHLTTQTKQTRRKRHGSIF